MVYGRLPMTVAARVSAGINSTVAKTAKWPLLFRIGGVHRQPLSLSSARASLKESVPQNGVASTQDTDVPDV
jgi:hypothetical protein